MLLTAAVAAAPSGRRSHSHSHHIHPRPHHHPRNRNSTAATAFPPPPQSSLAPPNSAASRQEQIRNIIGALIGAGDFNSWANILSIAPPSSLPLSATFFIPADDSLVAASGDAAFSDPLVFPYHIVPQRLAFADLRQFKPLSRLPTLLVPKTILITNNSDANFTLDGVLLSHPDLFTSPAVVVHGIANLMDYSIYGDGPLQTNSDQPQQQPQQQQQAPPQVLGKSPPALFVPAGEVNGTQPEAESGAECLRAVVWGIFLVILYVFLA
ncbi:unnamed protein product [Linum tenue]|uniref:FAS1 domain-containing protein n=1 Tax=Linum tenue TaxID=586396 RepID=A0AAV0QMB3_9ROSI|nr:unnamed protein product [Linum tenue]